MMRAPNRHVAWKVRAGHDQVIYRGDKRLSVWWLKRTSGVPR